MGALYFSKARQRWISEVSEGSPPNRIVRRKVARTKGEAELNLRSLRAEYARPTSTMTVGEYLASWLRTVERDVKASTWQTYEIAVRRQIEPAIGHVRLGDLAHDHVERMVRALRMSPKGIRNVLSVLSGALTDAERQGLVRGNAAAIVRRPRVTRKEPVALSLPEIRRILETVRGDRLEALYVVALASGLRQAELLGLRWEDWDRDTLAVRFALERSQGRYSLVEPKTRRSRRTVVLPAFANAALARHRAAQLAERLAAGEETEDGLIFVAPTGRPINGGWLSHRWSAIAKRAGVDISFHGLRHQQASLLVALGVHPRVIAERLGHATSAVTMDVYAHTTQASDREVARLLEEAIG
jgi:integrase